MMALSFQANASEKKEKKGFYVSLKYEVLIQCLGWDHSTSKLATSLPCQLDL